MTDITNSITFSYYNVNENAFYDLLTNWVSYTKIDWKASFVTINKLWNKNGCILEVDIEIMQLEIYRCKQTLYNSMQ